MANAATRLTVALCLLPLAAGCTTGGGGREAWVFKTAAEAGTAGPMAVWGLGETMGDAGLSCGGRIITLWIGTDKALSPGRPVTLRAGGAALSVPERFDTDGVEMVEYDVPTDSPLAAAIADGARSLRVGTPDGNITLPLGPVPARLAQECRRRAG